MYVVYVYPNGDQYEFPPEWASDDYEIRMSEECATCGVDMYVHYNEKLASCNCGTKVWDDEKQLCGEKRS